jgi:hypothetical protein
MIYTLYSVNHTIFMIYTLYSVNHTIFYFRNMVFIEFQPSCAYWPPSLHHEEMRCGPCALIHHTHALQTLPNWTPFGMPYEMKPYEMQPYEMKPYELSCDFPCEMLCEWMPFDST